MTPRFSVGKIVIPNATWRKHIAKHTPFKRCFLAFDHTHARHVSQHSQPLQRQFHQEIRRERGEEMRREREMLHDAMIIAKSWADLVEAAQDTCKAAFASGAGPADASAALATLHQRLKEAREAARRTHAAPADLPALDAGEPVPVEVRPAGTWKGLENQIDHAHGLAGEWIDASVHRARMRNLQHALDSQSRARSQLAADVRRLETENAELRRDLDQRRAGAGGVAP